MPRIKYTEKQFNADHRGIINRANEIIRGYADQGYDLTLRQLYYQFVARDWIPNNDKSYKKLGNVISDARRAGLIDWNSIVDRTRYVRTPPHWTNPAEIVSSCAGQFAVDFWKKQAYRPEVWVEKDALVGVLEVACRPWRVPYFSCRGYTSDSELWAAARRFDEWFAAGQTPIVYHFGDHDPSGIDMSRDIRDRLNLFTMQREEIEVRRIALTMDQVEEFNPPPNPAKVTDSRFEEYQRLFGDESWELDALNPETISSLIAAEMRELIEPDTWAASEEEQREGRRILSLAASRWDSLTNSLRDA